MSPLDRVTILKMELSQLWADVHPRLSEGQPGGMEGRPAEAKRRFCG